MRLLVVDDDPRLTALLARALREQSYAVDVAEDSKRAGFLARVNSYDALILDVMLPDSSGIEFCRDLRAHGIKAPVLMLTARDAVSDRVGGLDAGADDYLTKPFDLNELLARIRALLRRTPGMLPPEIRIGDLVIETGSHKVVRAGRSIILTGREYAMLEYLARNTGRVVTRAELCEHVWDDNHDPFSNAIEVYVNRLRKKIDQGASVALIHTRRGAGYLLAEPGI